MRAVILAGGFGTRLQEETTIKPKPMVEIGNRPVLWPLYAFVIIVVLIILPAAFSFRRHQRESAYREVH